MKLFSFGWSRSPVRPARVALAMLALGLGACGPSDASSCVTASCIPGNLCIGAAGGGTECRFPCATHTDCPFNYHCDANVGGSSPYCVVNTVVLPQAAGQWGAPCNPAGGVDRNPGCDAADGFWCNAGSPTDASAFCTRSCQLDTDCGEGDYCGAVNQYPNASSSQLQNGQTRSACLPRDYCAPCASDLDCAPVNGAPQHCLAGTDGATFCTPECQSGAECRLDATCTSQGNFRACMPRAGVCKGDGTLCAPCRSDADCPHGFCVLAFNSPERFCTSPSAAACTVSSTGVIASQCPAATAATSTVSCSVAAADPSMPPDQCIGQVPDGPATPPFYVAGCWTKR